MKILLDTCVSGNMCEPLAGGGHDVVWTGAWEKDPGDDDILAYAHREGRVLITLDKDFGELAVLHRKLHAGILRLVNMPVAEQELVRRQVLNQYADELQAGSIITAEANRLRIRLPD